MQTDHKTNDHQSNLESKSQSVDLQIKVLRRALARIQELQNEYQFVSTDPSASTVLRGD